MAAFLFALTLGPLCVFTPCLLRARRGGLLRYGSFASEYIIALPLLPLALTMFSLQELVMRLVKIVF